MSGRERSSPRPRLAPLKRIAEAIGIPYTSLRDVVARGELPILRVGRALYAEWSDVDK